jgi:hypothetical protein
MTALLHALYSSMNGGGVIQAKRKPALRPALG